MSEVPADGDSKVATNGISQGRILVFCGGGAKKRNVGINCGRRWEGWRGEELEPAAIAPESFQAQAGLVVGGGPELAGAFETALVLATGGLDGFGPKPD